MTNETDKNPWDDLIGHAVKKPIPVEFIKFDGSRESAMLIVKWARSHGGEIEPVHLRLGTSDSGVYILLINTLEGSVQAGPGAYVLLGSENGFWPIKASIFEATYDVPILEAKPATPTPRSTESRGVGHAGGVTYYVQTRGVQVEDIERLVEHKIAQASWTHLDEDSKPETLSNAPQRLPRWTGAAEGTST